MSRFALIAGGTGGHLFPAMALAQELRRRGHEIHLITDERVQSYGGGFPARETHIVPSATPSIRNPLKFLVAGLKITAGIAVGMWTLRKIRPAAVVGFGGYPVYPPFMAARLMGIPGVLHEQNAVMGRANRALAAQARAIALSFPETKFADAFAVKSEVTGNPVRDRVREVAAGRGYTPPESDGPLKLLIFGGSQGARVFGNLLPPAVGQLDEALRKRLRIVQQVRAEDMEQVAASYHQLKVNVELASFFEDLPERMMDSHLVLCRSGASTVAELGVLGMPAIMIPLPGSLDADQKANASLFAAKQAGWLMEQATVSPQSLAKRIADLLGAPDQLAAASASAKSLGQPGAVEQLADLTERVAGSDAGSAQRGN